MIGGRLIKVCGLRAAENMRAVAALPGVDLVGFIFHPRSPRCVVEVPGGDLTAGARRVGVFIDRPAEEILAAARRHGLDMIMLITPETSEARIRAIDEATDGFIYMVSSAATTGARDAFDPPTLDYFRRIAALPLRNPRMIGFGVSNRATFSDACRHASGAIIGSRFVSLLEEEKGDADRAICRLKRMIEKG